MEMFFHHVTVECLYPETPVLMMSGLICCNSRVSEIVQTSRVYHFLNFLAPLCPCIFVQGDIFFFVHLSQSDKSTQLQHQHIPDVRVLDILGGFFFSLLSGQ